MPAIEEYLVLQEINRACSRGRDPITGNSVLIHQVAETSPAVGPLERFGFLLAQGTRSGVFHIVTHDRADLLDLQQWIERNRNRDPGELALVLPAPLAPGEFTSAFQADYAKQDTVNELEASKETANSSLDTASVPASDLSVTKTMARPMMPMPETASSGPASRPVAPPDAPKAPPIAQSVPPEVPVTYPEEQAAVQQTKAATPGEFTRSFEAPIYPKGEPHSSGSASGIFARVLGNSAQDERTKLFPAPPESNEQSGPLFPPAESKPQFDPFPPQAEKKRFRKSENDLPETAHSTPPNATKLFQRPRGHSEQRIMPPGSSGPGDYTRVFSRSEVETPAKPSPEKLKSNEPVAAPPIVPKPENNRVLLIAILILGILLLAAIVTIGILLLRR